MLFEQAKNQREDIVAILFAEKLPVDDLPESLDNFLVAIENGKLIGVIGLEQYGAYGLLRSLAVLPEYRNKGIAGKLIEHLQSMAELSGLQALYLLTETAPDYFKNKGFTQISREQVPTEIQGSSEFRHVCPVSAIVMKKSIS
jgi:amino-acid N-acetyltransferase